MWTTKPDKLYQLRLEQAMNERRKQLDAAKESILQLTRRVSRLNNDVALLKKRNEYLDALTDREGRYIQNIVAEEMLEMFAQLVKRTCQIPPGLITISISKETRQVYFYVYEGTEKELGRVASIALDTRPPGVGIHVLRGKKGGGDRFPAVER